MPRYYTHYWKNSTWEDARRRGISGQPLDHCASNLFLDRRVQADDFVYVVTVQEGDLYLLSRLHVLIVCSVDDAAALLQTEPDSLWHAEDHIVADNATPASFDMQIPYKIARKLRFVTKGGPAPLKLDVERLDKLDRQTLRGVRELESSSAAILDELLPTARSIALHKQYL